MTRNRNGRKNARERGAARNARATSVRAATSAARDTSGAAENATLCAAIINRGLTTDLPAASPHGDLSTLYNGIGRVRSIAESYDPKYSSILHAAIGNGAYVDKFRNWCSMRYARALQTYINAIPGDCARIIDECLTDMEHTGGYYGITTWKLFGMLHRVGGPAIVAQNRDTSVEMYMQYGELHRVGAPAVILTTNFVMYKYWRIRGAPSRPLGMPTLVLWSRWFPGIISYTTPMSTTCRNILAVRAKWEAHPYCLERTVNRSDRNVAGGYREYIKHGIYQDEFDVTSGAFLSRENVETSAE